MISDVMPTANKYAFSLSFQQTKAGTAAQR